MALAWLLNLSMESDGVRLLFKGGQGRFSVRDKYEPYFYVRCRNPDEARYILERHPLVARAAIEHRFPDIRSRDREPLVKVQCPLRDFSRVVHDARGMDGVLEISETMVPHYFRYVMDKGLGFFNAYEVRGTEFRLAKTDELPEFDLAACRSGPVPQADVVFTYGGDEFLRGRDGVIVSELGCFLRDAIHIDVRRDMQHDIYNENPMPGTGNRMPDAGGPEAGGLLTGNAMRDAGCGLDGGGDRLLEAGRERLIRVIELSRMTGAKPDLISRISAGKLNCYLHILAARKGGHVVPDIRKGVERPKTLNFLREMDRGGTIFYPRSGIYENVEKCDFSSLYPGIIVNYNISPETMHCDCGDDFMVPGTLWRICRRRGVIPEGLEPVLKRRLELKAQMKASPRGEQRTKSDIRQRALKNILVTCFGYLGYSNFVFSNVETKECVVHYGRVIMERAKDIADGMGLDVLYGYVDSVFVAGGTGEDYRKFREKVRRDSGIELALDCTFRKLAFPSSRGCAPANHYYGITTEGEIEARGIAYRHSDSPEFIRRFQEEGIFAFLENGPEALDSVFERCLNELLNGRYGVDELKITRSVRSGEKSNQPHIVAYRQASEKLGFVEFVYTVYGPKPVELAHASEVEMPKYMELLKRARDELVTF